MFNNSLLYISAAIFGLAAAFGFIEIPKIARGMPDSKGNFELALIIIGSASALLGVSQFLFDTRPRGKVSALILSALGASLIYAEVFNVGPIKFAACEFLLHGKHHSAVYYDGNGNPFTPEERCKILVY